jgi:hypothetical protein
MSRPMTDTTISTVAGRHIDLLAFDASQVCRLDIAHQLARIRRFNGATSRGYSVAAHSLHVCDLVARLGGRPIAQLAALHHDSHEYLIGDMSTPVKAALNALGGGVWRAFENDLQSRVLSALKLRMAYVQNRDLIHKADMIALATEKRDLKPLDGPWPCLHGVPADFVDVAARCEISDSAWSEQFTIRDEDLREQIADRMGCPVEFAMHD